MRYTGHDENGVNLNDSTVRDFTITLDADFARDGDGCLVESQLELALKDALQQIIEQDGLDEEEVKYKGRIEHPDRPPIPMTIWVGSWEIG